MQLHESSFYSFVSTEGENWLREIIEKEGSCEIPREDTARR